MKVLVLLGGNSNEREVSLRSGQAVREALAAAGHEAMIYDTAHGYEGLRAFIGKVDCVFPILHGKGGEDGSLQEELENLGFKYLGADSKTSKICFDKELFKKELKKLRILTPKGEIVTGNSIQCSPLIHGPYVLKPVDGGSTIDTFIVRNPKAYSYNQEVFNHYQTMLLEELIEGVETTVPVLDNKALPVIEIIPPPGGEFDYKNKYNGSTQELCPPLHVSTEKQHEVQLLAEQIHLNIGVRHLSRTDIIIDNESKLWVLELNTMPGMTAQSLFPKAAAIAGITMQQLVQNFLDMVMAEPAINNLESTAK
jgi:D-alanine-D-alanine ligase